MYSDTPSLVDISCNMLEFKIDDNKIDDNKSVIQSIDRATYFTYYYSNYKKKYFQVLPH